MKEEKVFFEGEFGKICGVLHKVDGISEIVIVVHGFSSNKETGAVAISNELNKIGLNALRIDLDNQGESDLDFQTGASIPNYIKQVESSINYCKNLGYKEISLVGGSFGGITVFATSMFHFEIKRMVLRCPVVDYQKHLIRRFGESRINQFRKLGYFTFIRNNGEEFKINFDCYETSKDYSMFDNAKNIQIPTLIIQGDEDESVDWNLSKEVVKLFPNAKLQIIKGAGHNLGVNGDFSESLQALTDFFKE